MDMKKIYAMDFILVFVSVAVLIFAVGYVRPLVISPIDGLETGGNSVLFSIEKADEILIDDNLNFTTPDRYSVRDGLEISLSPGKYYWKALGVLDSDIRTLTVNSVIDLRLVEGENLFDVVNAGNVRLNVDVYNGSEKIDSVSVGVGDVVSGGDKFVGGMK